MGGENLSPNVFVFYCCGTKHPKMQWLKRTVIFLLTVLWVSKLENSLDPHGVLWIQSGICGQVVSAGASNGLIHTSGASTGVASTAGMCGLLSTWSLSAWSVSDSKRVQPGLLTDQQGCKRVRTESVRPLVAEAWNSHGISSTNQTNPDSRGGEIIPSLDGRHWKSHHKGVCGMGGVIVASFADNLPLTMFT